MIFFALKIVLTKRKSDVLKPSSGRECGTAFRLLRHMYECNYPHLFSPVTLGDTIFRNRIFASPHRRFYADPRTGRSTRQSVITSARQRRGGLRLRRRCHGRYGARRARQLLHGHGGPGADAGFKQAVLSESAATAPCRRSRCSTRAPRRSIRIWPDMKSTALRTSAWQRAGPRPCAGQGPGPRGHGPHRTASCRRRDEGEKLRLRMVHAACRARLSDAPVHVADAQPPNRRIWRVVRKPHALPAGES